MAVQQIITSAQVGFSSLSREEATGKSGTLVLFVGTIWVWIYHHGGALARDFQAEVRVRTKAMPAARVLQVPCCLGNLEKDTRGRCNTPEPPVLHRLPFFFPIVSGIIRKQESHCVAHSPVQTWTHFLTPPAWWSQLWPPTAPVFLHPLISVVLTRFLAGPQISHDGSFSRLWRVLFSLPRALPQFLSHNLVGNWEDVGHRLSVPHPGSLPWSQSTLGSFYCSNLTFVL